jgi:hypothetical protein
MARVKQSKIMDKAKVKKKRKPRKKPPIKMTQVPS